jgi:hypothetical protein
MDKIKAIMELLLQMDEQAREDLHKLAVEYARRHPATPRAAVLHLVKLKTG